ncbi:MAG: hypothetical protein ACRELG_07470 [Gemmataceae bacterium]
MRPFAHPTTVTLTILLLTLPALGADEKKATVKGGDKSPSAATSADKHVADKPARPRYVPVGTLRGTVKSVDASASALTLRAHIQRLEPDVQAQKNYLDRLRQLTIRRQQIAMNPNPGQAQQQYQQLVRDVQNLQQSRKNLYRVKTVEEDVNLTLAEDVKVRATQPGSTFDDKGNVKQYTPEELKELKGPDPKLPGFRAELTDLQAGQEVLVQVVRPRPVGRKPPSRGVKTTPAPVKLIVTLVLIGDNPMK